MILLDQGNLFSSGPCVLRVGPWSHERQYRGLPGINGELVLHMGRRSRILTQTGRLQADTVETLQERIDRIETCNDGEIHALQNHHGDLFESLLVESFELTTPPQQGRGYWCDYTLTYRQLS